MTSDQVSEVPEVAAPNWKIPPDRVKSDDCAVYIGRVVNDGEITEAGTPYHVHKGEWVDVLPCRSLAEMMAVSAIAADALSGVASLRQICTELSKRVVGWNWTGMDSQPLAQPFGNPELLETLTDDEVLWLLGAAKGDETQEERKNA